MIGRFTIYGLVALHGDIASGFFSSDISSPDCKIYYFGDRGVGIEDPNYAGGNSLWSTFVAKDDAMTWSVRPYRDDNSPTFFYGYSDMGIRMQLCSSGIQGQWRFMAEVPLDEVEAQDLKSAIARFHSRNDL